MEKIRWAIVGTGYIANQFAQGLMHVKDAQAVAVVSRNAGKAKEYANLYHVEASYDDYHKMLMEAKPDIVYIAVPNDCHIQYIIPALQEGVHVLSEKPMADNSAQLKLILEMAREKNLFVMEGMWTRSFPAVRQVRQWLQEGRIGKPLAVHAHFDIQPEYDHWQAWKAGITHTGGALRDVGIYALAMAYLVFPEGPEKIYTNMVKNSEVDLCTNLMLCYQEGQTAFLSGAFNRNSKHEVLICGEKGDITISPKFWCPSAAVLSLKDGTSEIFDEPYESSGFQYEIMRVQESLRNKEMECPDFTWAESIAIEEVIDKVRKEWGIIYPND